MSCIGLSIIFNKLIIVWISMDSKYSCVLSENTGIPLFIISCSNIFALFFVDLNNIAMSLYFISLKLFDFLSYTWYLLSINSFIFLATYFASTSISSKCFKSSISSLFLLFEP